MESHASISYSGKGTSLEIRPILLEGHNQVKGLKYDLERNRVLSIRELQDMINDKYRDYEGVDHRVILSGNQDEIRVKNEVDLSANKSQ